MRLVELNGGPLDGQLLECQPTETIRIPITPPSPLCTEPNSYHPLQVEIATYKLTCLRNNRILYRYIPTPKP